MPVKKGNIAVTYLVRLTRGASFLEVVVQRKSDHQMFMTSNQCSGWLALSITFDISFVINRTPKKWWPEENDRWVPMRYPQVSPKVMDIFRALKLSCKKRKSVSLYAYHLLGVQFLEDLSQIYEWTNQTDWKAKDANAILPKCKLFSWLDSSW
jgi:hypothetical protein